MTILLCNRVLSGVRATPCRFHGSPRIPEMQRHWGTHVILALIVSSLARQED
jgi:hypothetical protein